MKWLTLLRNRRGERNGDGDDALAFARSAGASLAAAVGGTGERRIAVVDPPLTGLGPPRQSLAPAIRNSCSTAAKTVDVRISCMQLGDLSQVAR